MNDHAETNSIEPPDVRPETVEGGEAAQGTVAAARAGKLGGPCGGRAAATGRWVRPLVRGERAVGGRALVLGSH